MAVLLAGSSSVRQGSVRFFSILACLVLLISMLTFLPAKLFAAGEGLSSPADKSATIGNAVAITDLQITGSGEDEMTLALSAPSGSFAFGTEAAVVTGSSNNVVLSGSMSEINTTLATLSYTPTEIGDATITADLNSTIAGVHIDPDGGHGYIMVRADDDCEDNCYFTWYQARDLAETYTYGGVPGYLAVITSQEENDFIYGILQENGWIGANDLADEGKWRWVTGPEEEQQQFWEGDEFGEAVNDMYANWVPDAEPNGFTDENCALFWDSTGGWNDLDCDGTSSSYVVEFGDGEDVPEVVSTQFTVTVNAAEQNISNCAQLLALESENYQDTINLTADIDCAGYEVEPLFQWNQFEGVFDGHGHTIRNVTIDQPYSYNVGLLQGVYNATIRNLNLDTFNLSGEAYVGALAGWVENTVISNVHATNVTLTAEYGYAGGLVGGAYGYDSSDTHIERASVSGGSITTDNSNIGGLIGQVEMYQNGALLIEQVFADIDITSISDSSDADTGGLIGDLVVSAEDGGESTVTIRDAYAWGDASVPEGENVGGLIGRVAAYVDGDGDTATVIITRAYASGTVTARDEAGGLIGQLSEVPEYGDASYELTNTFAMGKVTLTDNENTYQGGLIGRNEALSEQVISSGNYYDQHRSGQTVCTTDTEEADPLAGCTAVNTSGNQPNYFINNTTNPPLNTWNFSTIWVANTNVPPTFKPVVDGDNDGIDDAIEAAAPNDGDANGDGTPDNQQSHVASFVNPVNGSYTTLALDDSCEIASASAGAESTAFGDVGYAYQAGLVNFSADCSGGSTQVHIYQYGAVAGSLILRKFNPGTGAYFTITDVTITAQTIGGQQATVASYTIVDNGPLDLDPLPGKITDPVGLASAIGAPNTGIGTVRDWLFVRQ